jgi:(E)-4-hydroxy-3-methylbut-2-enyl-diphosphate synthase
VSVRLNLDDLDPLLATGSVLARRLGQLDAPLQYTLRINDIPHPAHVERLGNSVAAGLLPTGALALDMQGRFDAVHAWRALLAAWPRRAPAVPVVLRGPWRSYGEPTVDGLASETMLRVAAGIGGMLVDGVGEAVQLPDVAGPEVVTLAREILQATRMRLSQADFIACPSCGRTQFDLQSTTALIQEHLRHLKGLKIAVMGCIVNGPGEMADADFGYVGSGPGRIDLYVGHERIERNVPQAEAVSRLIELIRRHGRWTQPEA